MLPTSNPPTEVDTASNDLCRELVSLARQLEAGAAYGRVMEAAYQVEQARCALLEERAATGDIASCTGEAIEEASAPGYDPTLSRLERHHEVSTTLQAIEQYLCGLTAEMERAVSMQGCNI